MATRADGTVYAYNGRSGEGSTVAVKIGNKVVRFPTDDDWRVGAEVVVEVRGKSEREKVTDNTPFVPALGGFSIDG